MELAAERKNKEKIKKIKRRRTQTTTWLSGTAASEASFGV
jgi:hypothetical protein